MNLYFLVEGATEGLFYPLFIEYFFERKLNRVAGYQLAESNHYYLISCDGYPYIFTGSQKSAYNVTALKSAILEVNDNPVYDYLIVCLDTDEFTISERQAEFEKYIQKYAEEGVLLNEHCQLKLVAQKCCIETWFLGNRKMYSTNPNNEPLISYTRYFNVKIDDPELMGNYAEHFTRQDFHYQYLRAMLREKRLRYRKENLKNTIATPSYLEQLEERVNATNDLQTLSDFFQFCGILKNKLS